MSYNSGVGNPSDVKFKTLSCKSKVIIDSKCNLTINDAKMKTLQVKDETIKGNLGINGCITGDADGNTCVSGNIMVSGNVFVDGVKLTPNDGGGSSKYRFNAIVRQPISKQSASAINFFFASSSPGTAGHMYNGPIGVPLIVTFLMEADDQANPVISVTVEEVSLYPSASSGVLTISSLFNHNIYTPSTTFSNLTCTPTVSPSYWHYKFNGVDGFYPPYMHTIDIREL